MGVDWDDDDAILEDFASQKSEDKSMFVIVETSEASDTLDWGPKHTEGAFVKAGDPSGTVQIGEYWEHVDSYESEVYVGKAEKERKYQDAAVKWIGRR